MQSPQEKAEDLLREAAEAYFRGFPIMTDSEYDTLEAEIRRDYPNSKVFEQVGYPVAGSGWPKVKHPVPMGSIKKAQDKSEMAKWLSEVQHRAEPILGMDKLDGIAILLTYTGGKLVRAETRGDGHVGEDITRNVRLMKGVVSDLGDDSAARRNYIRGEIVCLKEDFDKHFPGESNPRNTAAGTAKRQSSGFLKCRHLTFYAFNVTPEHGAGYTSRTHELTQLVAWGFNVPSHSQPTRNLAGIQTCYDNRLSQREDIPYDVDGMVWEVDDARHRQTLGRTPDGLTPNGSIAYKYPHDSATTILKELVWQTGASGRITPVAVFEEVTLAQARVTRASLHNESHILEISAGTGLSLGAEIRVSRRNDVIPYVEEVIKQGAQGFLSQPAYCFDCGSPVSRDGAYYVCLNTDECPAQIVGGIKRWVQKTGVLHLGGTMVKAATQAGVIKTLGDLYRMSAQDLGQLQVEGRKIGGAAARAVDSLHSNKKMSVAMFVGSLGIPLCGRRMVQVLVDAGYDDLTKLSEASTQDLEAVPGFSTKKAEAFRNGFEGKKPVMLDLLAAGVVVLEEKRSQEMAGPFIIDGDPAVTFCFSGVRDKTLEGELDALGCTIKSGVSKNLDVLVLKDKASTSSKAKKARSLGVRILTLDELREAVVSFLLSALAPDAAL